MELQQLIDVCVKLRTVWAITTYAEYMEGRENRYREMISPVERQYKPGEMNSMHPRWQQWIDACEIVTREFYEWDAPRHRGMLKTLYAEGIPQAVEILRREIDTFIVK